MNVVATLPWIVMLLPVLACLTLALWPHEPDRRLSRILGVGSVATAFVLVLVVFGTLLSRDADDRTEVSRLYEWAVAGDLEIDLAIQVDPLSTMMMLVITGVGSLIILYSVEYMERDRDYRRFFAEMAFFIFSMLLLVLAGNYFFLIVGWALVGLASYLLIGYYYTKPSAVAAAKKAFVINVIGDVGMVLAAFILIRDLGTLDYQEVFATAPEGLGNGTGSAEAVAFLLFVGAAAKSAQIPLHTWLIDAMEGPTPVSALIHAATMVTAGVYMVVRSNALYDLAPVAAGTVAVVGGVTLFMAATIAIVQEDIKRVLAWSTVSQIGYMMLGAGLGLYGAAMFHLMSHAFFKALLFLSVGIVIHELFGEQSLNRMGGLKKYLRVPYVGVLVGCFAISGVPPFSGFFSKDEILALAVDSGPLGLVVGILGILGAGLTAFYMFRLLFRAFWGPDREGGYDPVPHPSRWIMAVPVSILALLAFVGGWIQVPDGWALVDDWLTPVLVEPEKTEASIAATVLSSVASLTLVVIAIGVAYWLFAKGPARRRQYADRLPRTREVLQEGYYFDPVYTSVFVEGGHKVADVLTKDVERYGIRGSMLAAGRAALDAGRGLRAAQTGLVRTYVFTMIAGLAIVGVIFVLAT